MVLAKKHDSNKQNDRPWKKHNPSSVFLFFFIVHNPPPFSVSLVRERNELVENWVQTSKLKSFVDCDSHFTIPSFMKSISCISLHTLFNFMLFVQV